MTTFKQTVIGVDPSTGADKTAVWINAQDITLIPIAVLNAIYSEIAKEMSRRYYEEHALELEYGAAEFHNINSFGEDLT